MRQDPRVETPTQSSPVTQVPSAIVLHPTLSGALAHLDIQLEDELARYRRQRTGVERAARQPGRQRSSEPLDLIAVPAKAGEQTTAAQPVPILEERLTSVAEPSSMPDAYKPIPAFTATPQPFDGAIALRANQPASHDNNADSRSLSSGEDAYALAQSTNPNLDDYLESSEELLRSLADEQAEVQAERHFMRSLLTPLGLGAMLLLLLSSAMFGYVIMNPSTLPWLTAKQNNNATGSPPAPNGGSTAAPQPDLAKRELPDLNLNNLGTVNVNPGTTPATTTGNPTAAPTPGSKPTIAATIAPAQQSTREPAASTPPSLPAATSSSSRPYSRPVTPQVVLRSAPTPASAPVHASVAPPVRRAPTTAPATPASSPSPDSGGRTGSYQYNVGIPFENDQTLEAARKVVPDAFVRTLPDGSTIVQVGVAHDKAEGQANAQKLRDQGLSSTDVYKR